MNAKSVAILTLIQICLITICIILSEIFLMQANIILQENNKISAIFHGRLPILLFHNAITQLGIFLYIIPITWSIISFWIISKDQVNTLFGRLLFWCMMIMLISLLLISIEAAFLPKVAEV